MGLIDKYVDIRITQFIMKHYEQLGYKIPKTINKYGNEVLDQKAYITVKTSDLTKGSRTIIHYQCDNCKKILSGEYRTYYRENHDEKTYCHKCANVILNSGINNHNYDINKTDEERVGDRSCDEYSIFVKKVLARDGYKCQCCGETHGALEVHHLYSYNSNKELRYDETNGITLCRNCHLNFHNKYGRGNNTKEQYLEWIGIAELELDKYNGVLPTCRKMYNYEKNVIYENGIHDALIDLNVSFNTIYQCCYTNNNTNKDFKKHGVHTVKNCHIFWYDDYLKMSKDEVDYFVNYKSRHIKKVICITTGKIFDKIKDAHSYYNVNVNGIIKCCKNKGKYSGKLPDGTQLEWMYYDEYLKIKAS